MSWVLQRENVIPGLCEVRETGPGVKTQAATMYARPGRGGQPLDAAFGLARVGADIADPQAREHPPQVRGGLLPCQLFLQLQC
jgi:hypothetical protein